MTTLKKKKTDIHRYRFSRQSRVSVFADTPGSKAPMKIISFQKPDNTQCLYNVVRDSIGKIVCIAKILYDDNINAEFIYEHYFDEDNKTFAFDRRELITTADEAISGGAVSDFYSKYFDRSFKVIGQENYLTNGIYQPIKADKDKFIFPDYKYTIYKNVEECLKGYKIKL
ncbi:hypothetical protein HK413_01360 [Mucilaginibacter sp. S1162]|uniref:Uncharacterized protein n=1 Tax=Mucilaginibacter humi TaxID=2732510 RepID=A0ABX1VZQ5_9SPHI|nr:hypothetical protein [Mucilaginibacter humi]NNU33158.1 hypothetical protein [Mucilaginibacter humi]